MLHHSQLFSGCMALQQDHNSPWQPQKVSCRVCRPWWTTLWIQQNLHSLRNVPGDDQHCVLLLLTGTHDEDDHQDEPHASKHLRGMFVHPSSFGQKTLSLTNLCESIITFDPWGGGGREGGGGYMMYKYFLEGIVAFPNFHAKWRDVAAGAMSAHRQS